MQASRYLVLGLIFAPFIGCASAETPPNGSSAGATSTTGGGSTAASSATGGVSTARGGSTGVSTAVAGGSTSTSTSTSTAARGGTVGTGGTSAAATTSPCENGVQDPDETAVDCGGPCGACVGAECTIYSDCATYSCDTSSGTGLCAEHCLVSGISDTCSCEAQAAAHVINLGGDVTNCKAYLKCYMKNECLPTDPCATNQDGTCGVNKIGGGNQPRVGAANVYSCACSGTGGSGGSGGSGGAGGSGGTGGTGGTGGI